MRLVNVTHYEDFNILYKEKKIYLRNAKIYKKKYIFKK